MDMISKLKAKIKSISSLMLVLILLIILGYQCPFQLLLGVPCPGCGMTRAWLSVLHLDLHQAFYYHPLFLAVPIMGVLLIFPDKIPKKATRAVLAIIIAGFFLVYIYRLIYSQNDIIYIDLENSIVVRYLRKKL